MSGGSSHTKREQRSSRKKSTGASRRSSSSDREYRPVPPSGVKRAFNTIWNVMFYIVAIGILVGAVLFKFDNSPTKSFYGYHFMTVKTNSMSDSKKKTEFEDGFPAGSFIIVKKEDPESLKVGDIITFFPVADNTSAYLTHRIKEVDTPIGEGEDQVLGLTTQGDANDGPDFPIEKSSVVGKVIWSMKGGGQLIDFVREKYVIVAILVVVLFAFTLTLKYYMGIPTLEPTRRKRQVR